MQLLSHCTMRVKHRAQPSMKLADWINWSAMCLGCFSFYTGWDNRSSSQSPQYTWPIVHNAPFGTEMWYWTRRICHMYPQTSNISRTSVDNEIVDHSDGVWASPVGAAPNTSSFPTEHLTIMDRAKTTARWNEKYSSFEVWCDLN